MSYQERAIWHYQQALQVFTQTEAPIHWADIQDNLGTLYQERKQGTLARNITQAITHHQQALQVLSAELEPLRWAMVQSNLGAAYFRRFRDTQVGNLNQVIAAYQASLQASRDQNLPHDYALTCYNLGLAYRLDGQAQSAYDIFANAIETVESLRDCVVLGEEVRQKLAEEWNLLYQGMVESCLALNNTRQALEYVERSKARNLAELLAARQAEHRAEHQLAMLQFEQMQALLPNNRAAILE